MINFLRLVPSALLLSATSYQLTQVDTPSKAAFATFTNTNYDASVTSAVPEPATWLTMILGMGAIGFVMRRRQKVTTRVSFAV